MYRQVRSFWKVLPKQAIGILIGTALPWTLWIAEIDFDIGCQGKSLMVLHLRASIPSQGFVEFNSMSLLPNPYYNIAQHPNEYFHAIGHKLKLFFIRIIHVDHS